MIASGLTHLAPDGIVLVSIPNGYGPIEIERFLFRKGLLDAGAPDEELRELGEAARVRAGSRASPAAAGLQLGEWSRPVLHRANVPGAARRRGPADPRQANGCLFGGEVTSYLHAYWPALTPRSLTAADRLPGALVSTWYFECRAGQPLEETRHAG